MPDNFKWLRLTAKDRERLSRTVYTNFNLAGRELDLPRRPGKFS